MEENPPQSVTMFDHYKYIKISFFQKKTVVSLKTITKYRIINDTSITKTSKNALH